MRQLAPTKADPPTHEVRALRVATRRKRVASRLDRVRVASHGDRSPLSGDRSQTSPHMVPGSRPQPASPDTTHGLETRASRAPGQLHQCSPGTHPHDAPLQHSAASSNLGGPGPAPCRSGQAYANCRNRTRQRRTQRGAPRRASNVLAVSPTRQDTRRLWVDALCQPETIRPPLGG